MNDFRATTHYADHHEPLDFLREKFGEIRHLISEAERFYSFEMMSVNCM